MANIADRTEKDKLREVLEGLASKCDASIPKAITEALKSLLTGMDYDDQALIRSSLESAMVSFAVAMDEAIQERIGWPQFARATCRQIWDLMRESPVENLDEAGTMIESYFDGILHVLVDLRDGPVKVLMGKGYEIKNALQLESDIRELQQLKKESLENWPWSNRELPPVDLAMLDASISAFIGGEKGERIENLIERLGGNPASGERRAC